MSLIAVDLSELADLIERMALFSAQLAALREVPDSRVRDVEATWSGAAADACAAALQRWVSGAREVHAALEMLRTTAATGHANYTAAIVANRRMWAQ
jgi:WXG100 family type VII secretion target